MIHLFITLPVYFHLFNTKPALSPGRLLFLMLQFSSAWWEPQLPESQFRAHNQQPNGDLPNYCSLAELHQVTINRVIQPKPPSLKALPLTGALHYSGLLIFPRTEAKEQTLLFEELRSRGKTAQSVEGS